MPITPAPDAQPDRLAIATRCAPSTAGDIVVCGSKDAAQRYRLPPLPAAPERQLPRAQKTLFGTVTGSVELEQAELPGAVSNRIMFRLKTPF